ncbi:MAG: GNAT family N-acetyltransferase [Nocardioidaceae bacterium]
MAATSDDVTLIRPMRDDDLSAVERLTDAAYVDLDRRTFRAGWPEPTGRTPAQQEHWRARAAHLHRTDPGGCWVADDAGAIVGAAIAMRRDTMWLLSTLAVALGRQGQGIGRRLLGAAASHGRNCTTAMLVSSEDPAAVRRYRLAGFDLHPTMLLWGRVGRDVLPIVEHVREGSAGDIDLMNSVDRQTRGSAHGPDHELLCDRYPLVVVDRPNGSGYAYVNTGGGPYVLAATSKRIATELAWETLAASDPDSPALIQDITPANAWAIDVGMAARMGLHPRGYVAVRDRRPPAPYLPSGMFL